MPSGGSLSLADVADRTAELVVACNRCDRAGRYRMDSVSGDINPRISGAS